MHHRDRELLAVDEFLDQHVLAKGPFGIEQLFGRAVGAFANDEHADRGALRVRLDHVRRRHRMRLRRLAAMHQLAVGERQSGLREDRLGLVLIHGDGGSEHAGMRVGELQIVEHALRASILAPLAVQGVEDGGWLHVLQFGDPARVLRIDLDDLVAQTRKRGRHAATRAQAHRPFGAQAPKKDRNTGHATPHQHPGLMRLVSRTHRSLTMKRFGVKA